MIPSIGPLRSSFRPRLIPGVRYLLNLVAMSDIMPPDDLRKRWRDDGGGDDRRQWEHSYPGRVAQTIWLCPVKKTTRVCDGTTSGRDPPPGRDPLV